MSDRNEKIKTFLEKATGTVRVSYQWKEYSNSSVEIDDVPADIMARVANLCAKALVRDHAGKSQQEKPSSQPSGSKELAEGEECQAGGGSLSYGLISGSGSNRTDFSFSHSGGGGARYYRCPGGHPQQSDRCYRNKGHGGKHHLRTKDSCHTKRGQSLFPGLSFVCTSG